MSWPAGWWRSSVISFLLRLSTANQYDVPSSLGPQPAEVIATARHLGLDDLGAEFGHQGAAERTGHDLGELENPDTVERAGAIGHRPQTLASP